MSEFSEFSEFNILESELIAKKLTKVINTRKKAGSVDFILNMLARLAPTITESELLQLLEDAELDTL